MKEQKAENDALVAFLSNPDASIKDYLQNNITANNTQLLTKDEYKETPFIKKQFTDKNGVFNEGAFDALYDKAAEKYFDLGDEQAFQNLLQYNPTSRYKPLGANSLDTSFEPIKGNNPTRVTKSISGLNVEGEQVKTEEELAQMGKIWDSEKKEWRKGTAESQNLFNKIFGTSLVYAQYDHDGYQENPVTGEVEFHRNGEWMKDEDGNYFTMTISKEELGNKKIVSLGDILTKEDSAINKVDFFDSDGFNKSIGGVAMKTVTAMFPYLIPGFNGYWGALTAAMGLASVMPTFYKAMDSMLTGGDDQSNTVATQLENWFRKFSNSKSRHGQESFFSFESVGELLADVFGQLHQQTAAANLAQYFYKTPGSKAITSVDDFLKQQRKMSEMGRALALGYMGLISTADVYNDAIQGGYDKRTAGIAALASAGALFGIMNFNESARGLGTWFLKKSTGYDRDVMRSPLIKIAKASYKDAEKAMNQYLTTGDSTAVNKFFGNFWANAKDKMQDIFVAGGVDAWPGLEGVWKSMIVEGVEEVSEEVVQDTVKGITDALSALGFTAQKGSFGGWQNVFSKEGASRYLQTLFGGALGGAVFDLQQNAIDPWIQRTFKDPNYRSERELMAEHDIIDVIFEGRTDELIDEVENLSKNIFNTKRGATGYLDSNGNVQTVVAEGQNSQADAVAAAVIDRIRELDTLVKGSLGIKDFKSISLALQEAMKRNYGDFYRSEKFKTYQQNKFTDYLKNMSDAYKTWQDAVKAQKEEKAEAQSESKEVQSTEKADIANLQKQFEYWRDKCRGMFNGEESIKTLGELQLLKLQDDNLANLTLLDFDTWYSVNYSKPFNTLEEGTDDDPIWFDSQKGVKKAYDAYKTSATGDIESLVKRMPILRETYFALQRAVKPEILQWVKSKHKDDYLKSQGFDFGEIFESTIVASLQDGEMTDELKRIIAESNLSGKIAEYARVDPRAFTLDERLNIDLASKLEEAGIINLSDFNDAQKKIVRAMINWNAATSRFSSFNADTIQSIITKTQRQLGESENIYRQAIINAKDPNPEGTEEVSLVDVNDDVEIADLHFDSTKITKDLESLKAKKIADILGEDKISPEMYRMIVNYAAHAITDFIITNPLFESEIQGVKPGDIFRHVKEQLENQNFLTTLSSITAADILVNNGDNPPFYIEGSEQQNALIAEIDKLQKQFGAHEILEKNPLRQAIEKIHFALGGTDKSKTIFDWLFKQETELQASDFTGDTFSLFEQDRQALRDARNTLVVLNAALQGMLIGGDVEQLGTDLDFRPLGVNSIQVQFLDAYKDGKGKDEYLILDTPDFKSVTDYVGELYEKLRTVEQIDSELFKSKSQYYQGLREQKIASHKTFIQSGVLKSFKLYLPDDTEKEIDLLDEFAIDENWDDETFVLRAREVIAQNIRKAYNEFNSSKTQDGVDTKQKEFIKGVALGVKKLIESDLQLPIEEFFSDAVQSWNAIQAEGDKITHLNGVYLVKELIKSLYISPQDEQALFNDIYVQNPENQSISPRIDQEEALINLTFMIDHKDVANDIQQVLYDMQKEYPDAKLIEKSFLENVTFLLGSGGAGKTLLLNLLSKYKANKKIFVTAKSEDKVKDLQSSTNLKGDTLYNLFKGLEDWDKGFVGICESIVDWAVKQNDKLKSDKIVEADEKEDLKQGYIKTVSKVGDILTGEYVSEHLKFKFTIDLSLPVVQINKFYFEETPKNITLSQKDNIDILFIDECTQLSPLGQEIIRTFAKDKGLVVAQVGDPLQPTWTYAAQQFNSDGSGKTFQIKVGYDISEYGGFVSGNLAGMWRAENDAIQDLITALYNLYTTKTKYVKPNEAEPQDFTLFDFSRPIDIADEDYDLAIKEKVQALPVSYTFDNKNSKYKFLGIVHNDDAITAEAILTAQDVEGATRVIIIPDNANAEEIIGELDAIDGFDAKKWETKKATDIQGGEVDYTLIYGFGSTKSGILDKAREGFMSLTRAKRGTIIHSSSTIFDDLGIAEGQVNPQIREYAVEARDSIARSRVERIEQLLKASKKIDDVSKLVTPPQSVDGTTGEEPNIPVPANLPGDGKSSTEKTPEERRQEQLKEMTIWREAFGGKDPDMSQLEPWYIRLGIAKKYTEGDWLDRPVQDVIDENQNAFDRGFYDFWAFIKIVQLAATQENFNGQDILPVLQNLGIKPDTITLSSWKMKDALAAFLTFRQYLVYNVHDFIRFVRYSGEDPLNWAYEKLNNNPDYTPYLFGGICIQDSTGRTYHITCGAFPQYKLEENGETRIISKTLDRIVGDTTRPNTEYFARDINLANAQEFEQGIANIHSAHDFNPDGLLAAEEKSSPGRKYFPYAQGAVQMKLRNDGNYRTTNGAFVDEADLAYGRMILGRYLGLNREIVRTVPGKLKGLILINERGIIEIEGATEQDKKENFKKLAERLRLDHFKTPNSKDISQEELQKIIAAQNAFLNLYKHDWVLIKQKGANVYELHMVKQVKESFRDTLTSAAFSGTNKFLTPLKHWSLIERLCKTVDDADPKKDYVKRLNDLKNAVYDPKSMNFKLNKNVFAALEKLLDDLQKEDVIKSNFDIQQVEVLCDSYLRSIERSVLYKGGKKYQELTTDEQQKVRSLTPHIITEGTYDKLIGRLIDQIDKKYPQYFYDNGELSNMNDDSVKIERVYELPPIFWNFDIQTPLNVQGNITPTPNPEPEPQDIQIDIKQILNDVLSPLIPGFGEGNKSVSKQFLDSINSVEDLIASLANTEYFNVSEDLYFGYKGVDRTIVHSALTSIIKDIKQKNIDLARELGERVNNYLSIDTIIGTTPLISEKELTEILCN